MRGGSDAYSPKTVSLVAARRLRVIKVWLTPNLAYLYARETKADGDTAKDVECYCPRCRMKRSRPISWLPRTYSARLPCAGVSLVIVHARVIPISPIGASSNQSLASQPRTSTVAVAIGGPPPESVYQPMSAYLDKADELDKRHCVGF